MFDDYEWIDASGIDSCLRGNPPACTCRCYFNFDIRGFAERIQRGRFAAAYRSYKNAVVFPEVISLLCDAPCKTVCVLNNNGEALNMPLLEQMVAEQAKAKVVNEVSIAQKKQKLAIVGGSISGLACAHRLASKGYAVNVYESREQIGGSLQKLLPEELLQRVFQREFAQLNVQFFTGHTVEDIDSIEADAVFIAICGGEGKCLKDRASSSRPVLTERSYKAGAASRCAYGLEAATQLESLMLTGRNLARNAETVATYSTAPAVPSFAVKALGGGYNAAEAQAEAKRCLLCKCSECIDVCDLMQGYKIEPTKVRDQILATLMIDQFGRKNYSRMADACTFCGKCTEVCPQKIDIRQMLRSARFVLNDEELLPPPYHAFWLDDMENATEENAVLLPDRGSCEYLYFPGCQLGASMPEYVSESYRMLKNSGRHVGICVNCCGSPAEWAGKREVLERHIKKLRSAIASCGEPTLIFACPNCMAHFARHLPEVRAVSLYDIWLEWGLPVPAISPGVELAVFDPCTAQNGEGFTASVRRLAESSGVVCSELPEEKKGRCCGFGGHIAISNRRMARTLVKERISYSELPYLTYCSNCRDIFAQNGKECLHILDVLCGLPERKSASPGLSERRKNRRKLLDMFSRSENGKSVYKLSIGIPSTVRTEMEEAYILEDEVIRVVEACEESGSKLFNKADGTFVGHLQSGEITVWVAYISDGDGFTVRSVYSHRMKIGDGHDAK